MPTEFDGLRREIDNLREWRHEYAGPVLWAVKALLEADPGLASLGGRIEALDGRVRAMGEDLKMMHGEVERMARASEIAKAVVDAQKHEKGLILTRAQKLTAGGAGVVLFAVAIVDFVRTFTG